MIRVEVQFAYSDQNVPSEEQFQCWASKVESEKVADVAVRIVDEDEMASLNLQYRQKPGPTNVLSFPAELPEGVDIPFLGDVIICGPIVAQEASNQGKSLQSH